ncbi:hypothetical protein ACOSQ2_031259 [Xanthoceras sorbifolium]
MGSVGVLAPPQTSNRSEPYGVGTWVAAGLSIPICFLCWPLGLGELHTMNTVEVVELCATLSLADAEEPDAVLDDGLQQGVRGLGFLAPHSIFVKAGPSDIIMENGLDLKLPGEVLGQSATIFIVGGGSASSVDMVGVDSRVPQSSIPSGLGAQTTGTKGPLERAENTSSIPRLGSRWKRRAREKMIVDEVSVDAGPWGK